MNRTASIPRLTTFTPLRYPGGKGKLAAFVKTVIETNDLLDGTYVEPYAGGAAIAIELLLQGYVKAIHINDISLPVFSFWASVLDDTDRLLRRIRDTRVTVSTWDHHKRILKDPKNHDHLDVGFATLFLNRTNRSGILNGGIIGGRDQTGPWKIDARFNKSQLAIRVSAIALARSRITLTRMDALDLIDRLDRALPQRSLIYLDPPYYRMGKDLYYDYYGPDDHGAIAARVTTQFNSRNWLVSYDDVPEVRSLYRGCRSITYEVGYSARDVRRGAEVMFFAGGLSVPPLAGSMRKPKGNRHVQ